jgi:hypothetical protein
MTRRLKVVGGKDGSEEPPKDETWSGNESAEQVLLRAMAQNLRCCVIVGEHQDGTEFIASTFETWTEDLGLLARGQIYAAECAREANDES